MIKIDGLTIEELDVLCSQAGKDVLQKVKDSRSRLDETSRNLFDKIFLLGISVGANIYVGLNEVTLVEEKGNDTQAVRKIGTKHPHISSRVLRKVS